jgi:hypothetical protein
MYGRDAAGMLVSAAIEYQKLAWRIVISPMIPQDFPPCYYSSMRTS